MNATRKYIIARAILSMTYDELKEMANDFATMQDKDSGVRWIPTDAYGEHGLMEMLHEGAEFSIEDECGQNGGL